MSARPDIPVAIQRDLILGLKDGLGVEDIADATGHPVALLRAAMVLARECGALAVFYRGVRS